MTTRQGGRPPQVRPRPPSTGRPVPSAVRSRPSQTTRVASHRKVERGPGIPFPFRILLIAAVAALGIGVLIVATGGLGRVAASIGSSFTGFVTDLTATPLPSPSPIDAADAPVLDAPDEPYTNQPAVDLVGTVPASVAGDSDSRIRIYVAIGNGAPGIVTEVPVGASQHFLVPNVKLSPGSNTFTATIVGPSDIESDESAAITYVYDKSKPRVTITSPKNNAVINARSAKVVGTTQARSAISAHNTTSNATVNGAADGTGAFTILVPIGTGANTIQITATDPAGNVTTAQLTVTRGTGKLTADLAASLYSIKRTKLPEPVTLTVTVRDPDGQPLAGANVTFTLAVPGVPAIASSQLTTGSNGRATFTTTIPRGATKGQTSVTAIVSTQDFGNTTDRTVINIT